MLTRACVALAGAVADVFYPPVEEPRIVSLKKGLVGMLHTKLPPRHVRRRMQAASADGEDVQAAGTYDVLDTDHTGAPEGECGAVLAQRRVLCHDALGFVGVVVNALRDLHNDVSGVYCKQ